VAIVDLLLPSCCAGCESLGPSPCPECAGRLRPAPALAPPPGLDRLDALLRYDDTARAFVTAVKYRNARASIDGLAPAVASLVLDAGEADAPPVLDSGEADAPQARLDVVTWAPTTPGRARGRGFDQAELLARAVARHLRRPVRRCLRRLPGLHQTGQAADVRHVGPRFVAIAPIRGSVLVVDDVCTTGATLSAAAGALRRVGARQVRGVVMARTPRAGVDR
jgi:predicted amidophosphoribosyltransferase